MPDLFKEIVPSILSTGKSVIHDELEYLNLTKTFLPPEKSGSAKDEHGKLKKHNNAAFLDEVYADRHESNILKLNRKIFHKDMEKIIDIDPLFRAVFSANKYTTLVSYYENSHYYKPHWDAAAITVLNYYFKEPKSFTGGEITLKVNDVEETKEIKNNMSIIFPGVYQHKVSPIKMSNDFANYSTYGRYCISQFTYLNK